LHVLVIGGTGFLSSAVVSELQAAGHRVSVFTRGQRPVPEGVHAIRGDRHEVESFARQMEGRPFDAVVDCICYTPTDAAADLRAFAGRVRRLVMISTDFVYGRHRRLPLDEDTATDALSEYGRGKAAAEDVLLEACRSEGFPVTVLRPPHIMGAGGQLGTGSLQGRDPMLLDRMERREPILLLDGGALLIQPVVHRDIGQAWAAVLATEAAVGEAYNVAGPDCVTTREYYDLIAATLGVSDPEYLSLPAAEYVRAYPDKAPFAQHRMFSVEKLARDTGYRPRTSLSHAVFEMVDWLQANEACRPYEPTEEDLALSALAQAYAEHLRVVLAPVDEVPG
jgi:nucleoside-diphosphate-sugar epimerase